MTGECEVAEMVGAELQLEPVGSVCLSGGHHTCVVDQQTAACGPGSKAARFAEKLLNAESEQFRALWKEHEVGVMPKEMKRFRHPEVGLLELNCPILLDPVESTSLLVYTAVPGSESYEKLQLLAIIGASSSPGG